MKFLILFLSLSFPLLSWANDVMVSPTFSIHIPFTLSTRVDLPSLHSKFYIVDESPSQKYQLHIVHNRPPTYANKFSVERYWKASRAQTKSFDRKEKNFGCIRLSARTYNCTRDVAQDGKFLSESIFWNTNKDLVLVRVSSPDSFTKSRSLLKKMKVSQNSKLVAGVVK